MNMPSLDEGIGDNAKKHNVFTVIGNQDRKEVLKRKDIILKVSFIY